MKHANEFDKLSEKVKEYGNNVAVLEEEIDLKLQMQYFKESKEVKQRLNSAQVIDDKDLLFEKSFNVEAKRILLSQLASLNEVAAFRAIEQYAKKPDESLFEWSKLAFQESKMRIESAFLDQAPLFISTGLGGKGTKLRYFIVLKAKEAQYFNGFQEKVVSDEFDYAFARVKAEIEEIKFHGHFATISALIPIDVALKKLFATVVNNCNTLGDFLDASFIVTNARKLTLNEIEHAIKEDRERANN